MSFDDRRIPAHPVRSLPDFEKRVDAARARAAWDFGTASIAGTVLGAFLDPDEDAEALRREKDEIDESLKTVGL